VASVEAAQLEDLADDVTINFPWGGLLDAALGSRADVLAAVARAAKPGASVGLIVSSTARDGREDLDLAQLSGLCGAYREAGLEMLSFRRATRGDVNAVHSSWGKRLGVGRSRPAFVINCVRR